jgi:pyruvate dehydrogenase E1 component alpha subunit
MNAADKKIALELYRKMMLARLFEQRAAELFQGGRLPGFLHSYLGEEGVAVGVCSTLRDSDYITSTHRGHGHVIAKGARVERMMAELFAKESGYCQGKGGSMHIADFSIGVVGATGIVGSGIPIATGVALACKMQAGGRVVACFFGDGASNTGAFHEGLNLAAVWQLPVLFVCENNLYAESTPQCEHQCVTDVSKRAAGYGMPGLTVDGNDVFAVRKAAMQAVERARGGEGPTLLECKTYRFMGHYVGDPATYRSKAELEAWMTRCPIKLLESEIMKERLATEDELLSVRSAVDEEIKQAVDFAENSNSPSPDSAMRDIYAGEESAS